MRECAACWRAVAIALLLSLAETAGNVHTVFTTECGTYFTWQALGMVYSHKKSGQPGKITRLMSCTDEQWERYPDKDLVPTHRAPSFTVNPHNNDTYSAYNKPEAVIDWLAHNAVEEDFVLILDADMIMRAPFIPEDLGAKEGTAISAYYGYLKGVDNELALKHVPEVPPRNDTKAGPRGRRGDQVGGFILMHQKDLRRMAPLWLKYSEDVRFDPDAWKLTGDVFAAKHKGERPWISEMYGYSFGAAKADVWHNYHTTAMIYPGYQPVEPPKVLHYGLLWEVTAGGRTYGFDKHWHYQFKATRCPPWDLETKHTDAKGGLFPHPPRASEFPTHGLDKLKDLLSIEVPTTLNEAFCEHHRKHCPASPELDEECGKADAAAAELAEAYRELQTDGICQDSNANCGDWAAAGECMKNRGFMAANCRRACGLCGQLGKAPKVQKPKAKAKVAKSPASDVAAPKLDEQGGGGRDAAGVQHSADGAAGEPKDGAAGGTKEQSSAPQQAGQLPAEAVGSPGARHGGVSPKLDAATVKAADKSLDAKEQDAATGKVPRAHAHRKPKRAKPPPAQANPDRARTDRLTLACHSDSRLSLSQVKACLRAAKQGEAYGFALEDGGVTADGSGAASGGGGAAQKQQQKEQKQGGAGDSAALLQKQLRDEAVEGGSDSISRRLRARTVHAPSKESSFNSSFLTKLGGICLVLWCGTVLLFLCLLPRRRRPKQRYSPYRARKESLL